LYDGRKYFGKFVKGHPSKLGTIVFPTLEKYEGEISEFVGNGSGRMEYPDGSVYEGEFSSGLR
jgi:hypothetical protein